MRCKLSEIALVSAGQGAPQGDSNYCESGTPFVKAGNLQELSNGASIDAIQKVSNEVAATHGLKLQRKGSVLFAKSGMSCLKGYVYVLPEDAYIVSHLACVTPMGVDSDYLCYYFRFHRPNKLVKDAAYPSISLADIGCLEIEIPEGNEVTQIVDALKRVESIINLHCQQFTALDTLIKARFVELFGEPEANTKNWPVVNMADLCIVGSSKRIYQSEQSMDGVPFWRISDLTNLINTGMATAELFISEERYMMLQAQEQVPVEGDILVTSRGTLGQCYIVRADDKFYFQDGMISWLSEYADGITPLYIAYLFSMPGFRKQIDSMQAGSTVAYLSIAMIRKLKVMLPDMETQNQFSTFVAQVDKSKAVVQAAHVIAQNLHSRRQQKCRILNF